MRYRFIFLSMLLVSTMAYSQNRIIGAVYNTSQEPLVGATVFIPELNIGAIVQPNGSYKIENVPNGKIRLEFSYVGYASRVELIYLKGASVELNVELEESIIESEEIVVTGGYTTTQHENAVKIDVFKVHGEDAGHSQNFMKEITRVPGVDMISKGNGVAKPVIRGLSMNDILVLNNGVRFENYQYSSHHPLGIDEFGIQDVEVIKGPASLMYGSDAIGGVLNFVKERPAIQNTLQGDYNLQLFSNSLGLTHSLGIKGSSQRLFGGLRVGQKSNSDYIQGGGAFVPNSRFNESSLKGNVGYSSKIGLLKIFYDYNEQRLGLVEEEALEQNLLRSRANEIFFQHLSTHLLSNQNRLFFGRTRVDINSSLQHTKLSHIGAEPLLPELEMQLSTLSYESKLYLPSNKDAEYIIGFQAYNQVNVNLNQRETILLPNASIDNYSLFTLLQKKFIERLLVQTGLRCDLKYLHSESVGLVGEEDYRSSLQKQYRSLSGSLGMTYEMNKHWILRTNIASAYRTPNLAELTSNGPHETRYEKGDEHLIPENSYEFDLSSHYHKDNFTIDVAAFYNRLLHFIYISPTPFLSSESLPVFQYMQKDATLYGGESGFHLHPRSLPWFHVESTFASVVGIDDAGKYLPLIPSFKWNNELRFEKEKISCFSNSYMTVKTHYAFKQARIDVNEIETPSYLIVDIAIGATLRFNASEVHASISADNLFDVQYVDHLSTLKEANYFNAGRNVVFSVKIPFGK